MHVYFQQISNQKCIPIYYVIGEINSTTYNVQDGEFSEKNFTTALKTKLDGVAAGANVNVNTDWTATSGISSILNKPTNVSTWTNDSGYLTTESDTLATVTSRGSVTTNDIGISNIFEDMYVIFNKYIQIHTFFKHDLDRKPMKYYFDFHLIFIVILTT